MTNSYKRRDWKNYLIDKEFQIKFIVKIYLMIFVIIAVVGGWLFYVSDNTLGVSAYDQVLSMKSARDMLMPAILSISIITAVISMLVIVVRFMIESHRIAGPVYRFGKVFDEVSNGDLTSSVVLRKNDEMQALSEKFNGMIRNLSTNIVNIKGVSNRLKNAAASNKIEEIRALVKELDDSLSKIKTD